MCRETDPQGREANEDIIQERGTDDRSEISYGSTFGGPATRAGSRRISALAPLHAGVRPSGCELYGWRSAEPHQRLNCRDRVPPKQRPASPRKRTTGRMDRIRGGWRTPRRATDRLVMKTLLSSKPNPITRDASQSPVLAPEPSVSTLPRMGMATGTEWVTIQRQAIARSGDSFAW
jgi:hypothetical protein